MSFKFVALFVILDVVNAGLVSQLYEAPLTQVNQLSATTVKQIIQSQPQILTNTVADKYDINLQYSDSIKSQQKINNCDVVRGQYKINDVDDFKRIVDYTDPINGFNTIISIAIKSTESKPIVKTAPIAYVTPAPYVKSARLTYAVQSTSHNNTAPSFDYVAPNTYIKSTQD